MSDLISRSEVLELLYKIFDKYYMSTDKNPSIISKSFGIDVFKEIKKMPTAYDIDKVMEELYEERTEILLSNDYKCEIINYCIDNFDKAIKIVKQDDISDDMCEWRKFNGSSCLFKTSCGNISGMYRGFNFCPYCGKKINEVKYEDENFCVAL